MAQSAIANSGWGLYTGRDWPADSTMEMTDVVIQVMDAREHTLRQARAFGVERVGPLYELLSEYMWRGADIDAPFDANVVDSILPGLGTMCNGHAGLFNLQLEGCADRRATSRSSPTAGASSSFQNCTLRTTTDIPAGHELYASYGDDWFLNRKDIFGDDVPLAQDYTAATILVNDWKTQNGKEVDGDGDRLYADWDSLYDEVRTLISKGVRRLWPKSAWEAFQIKGNIAYNEVPNAIRPLEWLEEHGRCVDHISAQPTLIRDNSERTAVTRRSISAGKVVAPAPVIHLNRQQLLMIDMQNAGDANKLVTDWQGEQLLLNYCYGHPSSTVLLFPYSPGVNLINHPDASLGQTPNVAVRWSKGQMSHPEWMQLTPTELFTKKNSTGLVMEFYALRDIAQGEELFLDYGPMWQQAWDQHVKDWDKHPLPHKKDYVSAYDYTLACNGEMEVNKKHDCLAPTASWLESRCWIHPRLKVTDKGDGDKEGFLKWMGPRTEKDVQPNVENSVPCTVLGMDPDPEDENGGRYRVEAIVRPKRNLVRKLKGLTRDAIFTVDQRYSSNQFLSNAFRHEIQLPDEMVPEAWKDLL